ncbi:hypothetical protein SAMN06297358_1670 [Pedobacter xixiisoli]|uniref:Lipoprotein n=1 Tax=Pedobacter xixiisoli TaxID=1476464 RepID=A0A285ZYB9_9SPHI|nr:hypothetical protein SAMN06297358_1670 [Pedobacter xixiisoli]
MRNLNYLLLITTLVLFLSCKKENFTNATIIKNCTGTYLQVLDKEYMVCNIKKTAPFSNGQKVLANYSLIKECKDESFRGPVCAMYYPNDGLTKIISIKNL